MTLHYLLPKHQTRKMRRKSKPRTMLQSIAVQCNWLIGFRCHDVHLGIAKELVLSPETIRLQCEVNTEMQRLRDSIKNDWKEQRRRLTGLDI